MPLIKEEAQRVTRLFVKDYPGALELAYKFRDNTTELYGLRAGDVPQDMKGGYTPKETPHAGRMYRGRVDVPLENMIDARDLLLTLRHEVLGHYGANTFTPSEKRALLNGLIAARDGDPLLKLLWANVDKNYVGSSLDVRAEEVYALYCEGVDLGHHMGTDQAQRGQQSFQETCFSPVRLMRADDLHSICCMVAQGLHDRSRTQQNFPSLNELFRNKENDMEHKKPFHEMVAEKLIEKLKEGTAPWQRPWQAGDPGAIMPINPTTGNRYKGINAIHLMTQGYIDQRWMTYKQAVAVDAQVRKGEKGTPIQYWKFSEEQVKTDAQGKPVLDSQGKPIKQTVKLERPKVFFATVFNAEQIDGLPALQPRPQQDWNAVERAEQILQASGAVIKHGEQNRAFYRPATDSIHLPDKSQFPTADNYYAVALHELGHWTGHESRLDRDLMDPFGSEGYAKEELRAEIASMILGDELGIGHDPGQHVAYIASWIKVLEEEPLEIFRAAADAEKIQDYVLGLEQKQVQEQEDNMEIASTAKATLAAKETHQSTKATVTFNDADFSDNAKGIISELVRLSDLGVPDKRIISDVVDNLAWTWSMFKDEVEDTFFASRNEVIAGLAGRDNLQKYITEYWRERNEEILTALLASTTEKILINVPFKEKDEAKALGAKWGRREQSWYVPAGVDAAPFYKWARGVATMDVDTPQRQKNAQERQYLAVPYGEHVAAKAAGAVWDKIAKSWYAGPKGDMQKLARWKPENVQGQQGPAMTPREEFTEALRSLGCVVSGEHPIMDGHKHRISVEGEKHSEKAGSGFYVSHLDGHPAGYIKNNKTGIDLKWKSKGYALDPQQKAALQAEAAAKLRAREAEQAKLQEATAQRVSRQMDGLVSVVHPTPYMQAKGIVPQLGVHTDKDGQKTYVPAMDVHGKQWTMQYIQEDGTKRFAKDSRKEACFHVVGGMEALAKAPALVIAEGYATASSLSQSLGFATVAAFDSGNLPAVAKALHEKFPDKPVIIAGDNDQHLEATQGMNPGKAKAEEAAKAVGGKILLPIFAAGEQLANPKGFTDFNDLANKSELGKEGVKRQVNSIVAAVIEKHQAQTEQQQEFVQKQRPRRASKI